MTPNQLAWSNLAIARPRQEMRPHCCSFFLHLPGWWFLRIDSVFDDRSLNLALGQRAIFSQCVERSERNIVPVHFEEFAQRDAIVAATEAIRAETDISSRHKRSDLIGKAAHVVGGCYDRSLTGADTLLDMTLTRRLRWVKQIPALGFHAIATQLVEAWAAPDIRAYAEVLRQQIRPRDDLAQNGAGAEKLHAGPFTIPPVAEQIHAAADSFLRARRHLRM